MDLHKILNDSNAQNTRNDGGDNPSQNRRGQASSSHHAFTGTQATHPEGTPLNIISRLAGSEMARLRQQSQAERVQQINTSFGEGSSQIPQESYESHHIRTQAHSALSEIRDSISHAMNMANQRRQVIESQFIQPQPHNEFDRFARNTVSYQEISYNVQVDNHQQAVTLIDNFNTINNFANGHAVNDQMVKKALHELSSHVESTQYSSSQDTTIRDVVRFISNNPHVKAFYSAND